MTNSPPSNVKLGQDGSCRVLACGIDSLSLAIQVEWESERTFKLLAALKELAKSQNEEEPGRLTLVQDSSDWLFTVKPHGTEGYEWILSGKEMTLKVGNWLTPQQRPSVMVDIRSESLWSHGPDAAVARALRCITTLGGRVATVKASRVDACLDLLLPESCWYEELHRQFITRARNIGPHLQSGHLSGFSIAKGLVSARLYDKFLEIRTKSQKVWMFDIWGVDSVPPGFVIIRIEFQIRRDRLKELGCNTWQDLYTKLPRLWAYCTRKWLRIVEDGSLHHTQQHVLPWWETVSSGFTGAQGAEPLVRERAKNVELRRCAAQVLGGLGSIIAIASMDEVFDLDCPANLESYCRDALEMVQTFCNLDDGEFTRRIMRKQARYHRSIPESVEKDVAT